LYKKLIALCTALLMVAALSITAFAPSSTEDAGRYRYCTSWGVFYVDMGLGLPYCKSWSYGYTHSSGSYN